MRRIALVCSLFALASLLGAGTCSGDDGQKGLGEPCTRAAECAGGLECQGGVCREPPTDGSPRDGG